MKYEKPEMEIWKFGEVVADLDIVGGSNDPDSSDAGDEW